MKFSNGPSVSFQWSIAASSRSTSRSAERRCQHLNAVEPLNGPGLAYINRLSDLLFVAARLIAKRQGVAEILWQAADKPAD